MCAIFKSFNLRNLQTIYYCFCHESIRNGGLIMYDNDELLYNELPINKATFVKIGKLRLIDIVILIHDRFNIQKQRLAMGIPLSEWLPNFWMSQFDKRFEYRPKSQNFEKSQQPRSPPRYTPDIYNKNQHRCYRLVSSFGFKG